MWFVAILYYQKVQISKIIIFWLFFVFYFTLVWHFFDFKGHIIKIMLEIVLNNLKVAKIKVFAWISRSFLSNVVNLWISNMAAIIDFGHYCKFYGSDVKNYHKNGYFAPENVYIDGSYLWIINILIIYPFFKNHVGHLGFV